jgi:hypothetical protein
MNVHRQPQARIAAALVAAGVVSAASVVTMPVHPTVHLDIADASAVTDALGSLGKGVEVLSSLVGIHVDATISVPFEATLAIMAARQNPMLAPNVLSYLVQRFVNPAFGPPITAYPWETEQTAALVASLFPYPLGPSATDIGLINQARFAFADVFNSVLGQLPDPTPGYHAVQAVMNDTVLGGAVVAGQLAVRAPLYMAWNTVNYLGNVPVNLEATLESAVADPSQIPGLISNLVHGLLSPDANVGLLGQLLDNAVDPLTWLPAPVGYASPAAVGLANQVRDVITTAVNGLLSLMPAPVTPSALPVPTASQSQPIYAVDAGKGATAPDAVPSTSLAAVTVVPAAAAEKTVPTTSSKPPESAGTADTPADAPVAKDAKDAKDANDTKDAKDTQDTKGTKESTDSTDARDAKGTRGVKDSKGAPSRPGGETTTTDRTIRPSTAESASEPAKAEPGSEGASHAPGAAA